MADSGMVQVDGLRELLRALNRADREMSKQIRVASKSIAADVAEGAARRARMSGIPQLAAVAGTYRAVSDRVPAVRMGGAKRVTSSGASASDIVFGADFGAHRANHPQFPKSPPVKGGRTIYREVEARRGGIADAYLDAVEDLFMHGEVSLRRAS